MRAWARYLLTAVLGVAAGTGAAAYAVRSGALGSGVRIGPWSTGTDLGTADASARTRAVVALRSLLALPAREARYYNAATDDAGRPLEGRCRYRVAGGRLPGRWWSLTLYDADGYLVANDAGTYSVPGAAIPAVEQANWTVVVAPDRRPGHWLPTGNVDRFELTLRTYLPDDAGRTTPPRDRLPRITREECA